MKMTDSLGGRKSVKGGQDRGQGLSSEGPQLQNHPVLQTLSIQQSLGLYLTNH